VAGAAALSRMLQAAEKTDMVVGKESWARCAEGWVSGSQRQSRGVGCTVYDAVVAPWRQQLTDKSLLFSIFNYILSVLKYLSFLVYFLLKTTNI
jgi:hypothetical protein